MRQNERFVTETGAVADWTSYDSIAELLEHSTSKLNQSKPDWRTFRDKWRTGGEFGAIAHDEILAGSANPLAKAEYERIRGELELDTTPADLMGESARRRRVWSDQGDPDTDRVLDRRELWAGESRRGKLAHMIRLGVNITRSCGNGHEGYAKAAAYCAAVADQLVKLGYAVEIVGCSAVVHGQWTIHSWPLKRPNEPLDIERILSMGNCALHRLFILDALRPSGMVNVPPKLVYDRLGIDYVFGKQWSGGYQSDIWQGVRNALSGKQDDRG